MTTPVPVALADPPFERPHPRVTVVRQPGSVNSGDGRRQQYVVRFVVDGTPELLLTAPTARVAARRGSAVVREYEPRAVWLLNVDHVSDRRTGRSDVWRPLAGAAGEVQAAFVAWTGRPQ